MDEKSSVEQCSFLCLVIRLAYVPHLLYATVAEGWSNGRTTQEAWYEKTDLGAAPGPHRECEQC